MKISTRINGRVTSIMVRDSILALNFIINGKGKPENHALDTCHNIISKWKGTTGKGLSSFITDTIVQDVLADEDVHEYIKIKDGFEGGFQDGN